jgi:hypothetical protein
MINPIILLRKQLEYMNPARKIYSIVPILNEYFHKYKLNYPITKCVCENPDEVLGISLGNFPKNYRETPISGSSNILNIIFSVIYRVIHNNGLFTNDNSMEYPYQFILKNTISLEYVFKTLYEKEEREHLVNLGIDFFINKMKESMKE